MQEETVIQVRGYHCDFYGHVNNARYLEFFEEDRWRSLETKINLRRWKELGLTFLVVNINVNYRKAIPVGEIVVVRTGLERVGNRSAVLKQGIFIKETNELVADALVTFVVSDRSGKAMNMEGELLSELQKIN